MYTSVNSRLPLYRRHTFPLTSCSEVIYYVLKKVISYRIISARLQSMGQSWKGSLYTTNKIMVKGKKEREFANKFLTNKYIKSTLVNVYVDLVVFTRIASTS